MTGKAALSSATLVLVLGAAAQIPGKTAKHKPAEPPRKLRQGKEVFLAVPRTIREDLCRRASDFVLAVYPRADEKIVRQWCARDVVETHQIIDVSSPWELEWEIHNREGSWWGASEKSPVVFLSFPDGRYVAMRAKTAPPGVKLEKRGKPLTAEESERIAVGIAKRVAEADLGVQNEFLLSDQGHIDGDDAFCFSFHEKRDVPFHRAGSSLRVEIREADGVVSAKLSARLDAPAKPLRKILLQAKQEIPGFDPKWMILERCHYACKPFLRWRYAKQQVNREPAGVVEAYIKHETIWDAETGEVLYSEVLKGGTRYRRYHSQKWRELSALRKREFEKALPDILANLNALMMGRAAKLSGSKGKRNAE